MRERNGREGNKNLSRKEGQNEIKSWHGKRGRHERAQRVRTNTGTAPPNRGLYKCGLTRHQVRWQRPNIMGLEKAKEEARGRYARAPSPLAR
jgi:hypothetical protein